MNLTLQSLSLGLIIGTVCILMLAVVLLPAFGAPIDPGMSATVTTAFIGMAGTAGGWLARSKEQDAKTAEVFQRQRAEILTLKAKGSEER